MKSTKSKRNASQARYEGGPVDAPAAAPSGETGQPPPGNSGASIAIGDADRFLETTYRNGEFTREHRTLKEILARDLAEPDVDACINEVTGKITIRKQNGALLTYMGRIPGLGDHVGRQFLEELMWQPGELLTVERLLRNPNLKSFWRSDARAARLMALRTGFGETADDPWYFVLCSGPWRICWRSDRSWRIVERLAQAAAERCA